MEFNYIDLPKATGKPRELQLKILDIIKDIDKLCRENDIEYYLFYGSAIGAVRHGGYIPWDDDLDIAMTYDNYLKFLRIGEEKLDKKYYIQTNKKEKNYYLQFAKVRDTTTTLIEENNKDIDIVRCVYVDIFPLVGVPNNKFKQFFFKINRAFMLSADINVINNKHLYNIFNFLLHIFGREAILKFTEKQCYKYDCASCDKLISIGDGCGFDKSTFPKEMLGKPIYVPFEDTYLPIPNDYDSYLKIVYGDYMKIPSQEEIASFRHDAYYLDFNLPYAEYKKKYNN